MVSLFFVQKAIVCDQGSNLVKLFSQLCFTQEKIDNLSNLNSQAQLCTGEIEDEIEDIDEGTNNDEKIEIENEDEESSTSLDKDFLVKNVKD